MKWKFFGALITALLLFSCASSRRTVKVEQLDGSWVLAVFPYQKKTLAEVFGSRVIEMQFDKMANTVSGTTGCNRFAASYSADTANLVFSQNRALTKMACPDYNEQLFLTTLDRVNRYKLIEGQLELMQNDEIVMIFAKKL